MSEEAGPTTLVDLIDKLVQPPEPEPVSMVPQTAGWVVLAVLAMLAVAYGLFRLVQYRRRNAYRRQALADLARAGGDAAAVALILRRAALAAYPRTRVAGLSGTAWLQFLDDTAATKAITHGAGQAVAAAPYQRPQTAGSDLLQIAKHWIQHHRAEVGR